MKMDVGCSRGGESHQHRGVSCSHTASATSFSLACGFESSAAIVVFRVGPRKCYSCTWDCIFTTSRTL